MKISLFKKITISFLLVTIGSVLIASFISNRMIDRRFNQYLKDEHKRKVTKMKMMVESL